MGVTNRALDASEQLRAFSQAVGSKAAPLVTSATAMIGVVPFSSELRALTVVGHGLSSTPTGELRIQRFIPGGGFTMIAPGISFSIASMGLSGPVSVSLPAQGHSLLQCLTNDQFIVLTGTANTSTDTLVAGWVLKALQDIKSSFGGVSS